MIDEKEMKMKLLEELMDIMDSKVVEKLKPSDKVQVTEIESKEMPIEDLEAKIEDKLAPKEEPEIQEEDEDYGDSRLMQKLMALKKKKAEME